MEFEVLSDESQKEPEKNKWDDLLVEVGLPTVDEITELTPPPKKRSMPIDQFRELYKIQGRMIGTNYYRSGKWCLAGSAVLGWLTGSTTNDYDFFPENIDAAQELADYLTKEKGHFIRGYQGQREFNDEFFGAENWTPPVEDVRKWYLKLGCGDDKYLPEKTNPLDPMPPEEMVRALNFRKEGNKKMRQIVLLIRGTPIEVIDTFDFSISQWAIDGENIYWGEYTLQDASRNRVRINRIHHPMSTMRRMLKYSRRGYFFCNGTMLDIARGLTYFADAREDANLPLFDQPISLD